MSEAASATEHEDLAVRALLRGTKHVATLVAPDGTLLWVSPSVEQVLGYAPAEVVGHNVVEYIHPDDVGFALTFLNWSDENAMDGGIERDDAGIAFDVRLRHRNGRWITIEGLTNNFLADPDIGGLLLIGRDVTARRILEDAVTGLAHGVPFAEGVGLALSFLDARIAGTSSALWWPGHEPAWTTASVPEALQVSHGPWVGLEPGGEYLVIEDLKAALGDGSMSADLIRSAVDAGFSALWCIPVPRNSPIVASALGLRAGTALPKLPGSGVLVTWSRFQPAPLFGHQFQLDHVATMVHFAIAKRSLDLQQEAQLAEERRQHERLAHLETLRTDLVMNVSHDLRTPLTSIIGAADLLTEAEQDPGLSEPEERATYLEIVSRNAHRLLDMIDDLLFLAQFDSGVLPTNRQPVDVGALVAESVGGVRPVADAKGVEVALTVVEGSELHGDRDRLHLLVDNLISNAVKYTPSGGHVRVEARPAEAGGWQVSVADDGIGIPAGEQVQVFERFARGSNARAALISGSGLGLVIAKAVAELHGGRVTLESEEGQGSTFVAHLGDLAA